MKDSNPPRWLFLFAAAALAVPVGLVLALILAAAAIGGAGASTTTTSLSLAAMAECVTTGPLPGLDATQAGNARTVFAVAVQQQGYAAGVIATMTVATESNFYDLGNTNVPGSDVGQGMGSDHDSVGLFQQRPSWGTLAQRLDPTQPSALFLQRLAVVDGWDALPPWEAAQAVQISAFTGVPSAANGNSSVVGGNYQAHYEQAEALATQMWSDTQNLHCGEAPGQDANPDPASHGLPADYVIPASATADEKTVVTFAVSKLGGPYVFGAAGGTDPASGRPAYDCSGLTMAAWSQVGFSLPHSAALQSHYGSAVSSIALAAPGDLVFSEEDEDGPGTGPGHVGIYLGAGLVESAMDPDDGIKVQSYAQFASSGHGVVAIRHLR